MHKAVDRTIVEFGEARQVDRLKQMDEDQDASVP